MIYVQFASLGFGPFHCEKNNNYEVICTNVERKDNLFLFVSDIYVK